MRTRIGGEVRLWGLLVVVAFFAISNSVPPSAQKIRPLVPRNDSTAPVVTITTNGGANISTGGGSVVLEGTAVDTFRVVSVTATGDVCTPGEPTGTNAWSVTVPVSVGTCVVTVSAADATGNVGVDTIKISRAGSLAIATTTMPIATAGSSYLATIHATGGTGVYTFTKVAAGASLNDGDPECAKFTLTTYNNVGRVTGTSALSGAGPFTCTWEAVVTDSAKNSARQRFTLTINGAGTEGPHDYFEMLRKGPYCHTAWSLRPKATVKGNPYGNCDNPHWRDQLNYTNDPSKRRGHKGRSGTNNANTIDAGGFKEIPPSGYFYAVGKDTHPEAQDAAKFTIPAFVGSGRLDGFIDATQTTIQLADRTPSTAFFAKTQHIRIDDEIMVIQSVDWNTGLLGVARGQKGTTATAHADQTKIYSSYNSLDKNELITIPLGTAFNGTVGTRDGHTYVFVWDDYLTADWQGHDFNGYKAYNFLRGTNRDSKPWLGIQVFGSGGGHPGDSHPEFDADNILWYTAARTHMACLQPHLTCGGSFDFSKTDGRTLRGDYEFNQPILRAGDNNIGDRSWWFRHRASRWTRYIVKYVQVANDYDKFSLWRVDEVDGIVQVHDEVPVNVNGKIGPDGGTLGQWVLEWDTSRFPNMRNRGNPNRDFVIYARNFIMLTDPTDEYIATTVIGNWKPRR